MADNHVVTYERSENDEQFKPAPIGLQQLVCVDGIYLGWKVDQYQNQPPKLVEKYALVFQTSDVNPATGRRYEIQKEFTTSMGPKSNLRKFLASWRGLAYTDEEARRVELGRCVGVNGLGTVEHKTSGAGRLYAIISNITPLMKGMPTIGPENYTRAPFWDERKQEYASGVQAHRAQNAAFAQQATLAQQPTATVPAPGRVADALQPVGVGVTNDPANFPGALESSADGLPF